MKALLMHRDRDFLRPEEMPREQHYRDYGPPKVAPHERALMEDLEIETVLRAMAAGDAFLHQIARRAALSSLRSDVDTICYRQAILRDCLANAAVVRQLYSLTVETSEEKKKHWWGLASHYAGSILHGAVDLMQMLAVMLRRLRDIADVNAATFKSEGFTTLFATLARELSDEYLATVHKHLTRLKFKSGVLLSAQLGEGNAGTRYVLREPKGKGPNWLARLLRKAPPGYTFHLHPRDEAGAQIVGQMRDRGINLVANALAQSAEHVESFFDMLRAELAFYVGCLNLHDKLTALPATTCFPEPHPVGARRHRFTELYDASLALTMGRAIVGNTIEADHKSLVIITGANQGGKSSFLRSIGLAQVMMQAGMFVAARSFSAEVCDDIFTHYKREEDATMKAGKFDEEVHRMSDIVDAIGPGALMLFNESFASTNEREGSEIARQVVDALLERRIKVLFVTHLYHFAHTYFVQDRPDALYLRAERQPDGTRTFQLVEGEPLATSYGEDVYRQIFAGEAEESTTARAHHDQPDRESDLAELRVESPGRSPICATAWPSAASISWSPGNSSAARPASSTRWSAWSCCRSP